MEKRIHGHQTDDNGDKPAAAAKTTSKNNSRVKIDYEEYAWFIVFLTALSYFIVTRRAMNGRGGIVSSFSKPYDEVSSYVAIHGDKVKSVEALRSIFYITDSQQHQEPCLTFAPKHRLEVLLSSPPDIAWLQKKQCLSNDKKSIPYLSHLSSTTWVHDDDLGRGYLLLADAGRSGRIWRWEVGGGPITIGRSLYMERSGCRSGLWVEADEKDGNRTCPVNLFGSSGSLEKEETPSSKSLPFSIAPSKPPLLGTTSIAVELNRNAKRSSSGKNIIVAEWGERRIIRLEGATGARTPLATLVPNLRHGHHGDEERWRRVLRPNHLTYTPFGDLLFSDNFASDTGLSNNITVTSVGVVYRRKEAVHTPPIAVEQSRDAHAWTGTTGDDHHDDDNIDVLFQTKGLIEGMALESPSTLYILVTTGIHPSGWKKTVYKLRLDIDNEDEYSEDDNAEKTNAYGKRVSIFHETTSNRCKDIFEDIGDQLPSIGSKLAIDQKGTVYLISCPSSMLLLSKEDGSAVGTLELGSLQKSNEHTSREKTALFTSIGFGEDGYLYITSPNELMRVKNRVGGMSLPTNLVVPPPIKSKKDG